MFFADLRLTASSMLNRSLTLLLTLASCYFRAAGAVPANPVYNCEAAYLRGLSSSGSYQLYTTDGRPYYVYCMFTDAHSGFAFPSRSSVRRRLLDLDALRTSNETLMIYFWIASDNGENWHMQSVFRPAAATGPNAVLMVNTSWLAPIPQLDPAVTGPYLYASIKDLTNDIRLSQVPVHQTWQSEVAFVPNTPYGKDGSDTAADLTGNAAAVITDSHLSELMETSSSPVKTDDTIVMEDVTTSVTYPATTKLECPTYGNMSKVAALNNSQTNDRRFQKFMSNGQQVAVDFCDSNVNGLSSSFLVFFVKNMTSSDGEQDLNDLLVKWLSTTAKAGQPIASKAKSILSDYFFHGAAFFGDSCGSTLRYIGPRSDCSGIVAWTLGVPFYMSDECASNPCLDGATCRDGYRSYTCLCHAGYRYNGTSCTQYNAFKDSTVVQSSTVNGKNALLAVDGDVLTCSSTRTETVPWWQIDIGNYYHLHDVIIYTNAESNSASSESTPASETLPNGYLTSLNALGGPDITDAMHPKSGIRFFNIEVRVGNDPEVPSAYKFCAVYSGPILSSSATTLNCRAPLRGRYVRLQRNEPQAVNFELCEVKLNTVEQNAAVDKVIYASSTGKNISDTTDNLSDCNSSLTINIDTTSEEDSSWMIDMETKVQVDFIELSPQPELLCSENLPCDRLPTVMTLYSGSNGVQLTTNGASTLDELSPHSGRIRRWYCSGSCTGRFHGIYFTNSTLGSLDGCTLKIYLKQKAAHRWAINTLQVYNASLPGSSYLTVYVQTLIECVARCVADCRNCVSINVGAVGSDGHLHAPSETYWRPCELNNRTAAVEESSTSTIVKSPGWNFYAIDSIMCL